MSPFVDKDDDTEGEDHADDRVHAKRKTSSFENTTNAWIPQGSKPPLVAGSNGSDLKVCPPKKKPTLEPAYKNEWSLVAVKHDPSTACRLKTSALRSG
jgi:hypothetical protein